MAEYEFDGLLIHDLKNPLSGIMTGGSLLADGSLGELTGEQQEMITNINLSAKMLANLLAAWQTAENLEQNALTLEKQPVNPVELAQGLEWLKSLAKKEKKEMTIDLPKESLIATNRELLRLVLETLLLTVLATAQADSRISLTSRLIKNELTFAVESPRDNLPRENLARAFDRDFKLKYPKLKARAGRGLGLYFCRLAVEALGGKIKAEEQGEGIKFSFSLIN